MSLPEPLPVRPPIRKREMGMPFFLFQIGLLAFGAFMFSQAGGWFVRSSPGVVSPVWPVSGFALAAALWFGLNRALPAVYLGMLASNYLSGDPMEHSLTMPLIQILETLVGYGLIRLWRVDLSLPGLRDFGKFVAAGCLAGPALGAGLVLAMRESAESLPIFQMSGGFVDLWQAAAFGTVVFGPFFLFAFGRQDFRPATNAGRFGLLGCSFALWVLLAILLTGHPQPTAALILIGGTLVLALTVSLIFGLRSAALFQAMFVFLVPACVVIFPEQARTARLLQNEGDQQFIVNGLAFFSSLGCLLIAAFRDELSSLSVKFNLAMESANLCMWEWSPSGWFCHTPGWAEKFGLASERLIDDEAWRDLVHPADREEFDRSFAILEETGSPHWSHVYRICDASGHLVWVHSHAQPIRYTADDELAMVAGVTRDITEERESMQTRIAAIETEAELRTLRSQLNPHFLFNALNSVRALIGRQDARAKDMITSLGNLLRGLLSNRDGRLQTVERELEIVGNYLAIETIRFGERLRQKIECSTEAAGQLIPGMLILTLVENAVKHGVSKLDQGGLIEVRIRCEEDPFTLVVSVINDGELGQDSGAGFGLANTRRRIALVTGGAGALNVRQIPGPRVEALATLPMAQRRAGL